MRLDLYPERSREKIERLFESIDRLPFTKIKKCQIWNVDAPHREYPTVTIDGIVYRLNRLVLQRKLARRLRIKEHALHNCDHPRCVNEDHLYPGDVVINANDRTAASGSFALRGPTDGRVKSDSSFALFKDEFGARIQTRMRFMLDQFVTITGGSLNHRTARTVRDVPMTFKINSKVQIRLTATGALHWIQIKHLA